MSDSAKILRAVPWGEVHELADSLLADGLSKDESAELISESLDEMLQFNRIIRGPAGAALEAIDGPVLKAAVKLVLAFSRKKNRRKRKAN